MLHTHLPRQVIHQLARGGRTLLFFLSNWLRIPIRSGDVIRRRVGVCNF